MDAGELFVQAQATKDQRCTHVIGQRAAHRRAVSQCDLAGRPRPLFGDAFQRAHTAHQFLEFFLGMPVRLPQGARRLLQIMELAQLMRHPWQGGGDRLADTVLAIGYYRHYRHRQGGRHVGQQALQLGKRR